MLAKDIKFFSMKQMEIADADALQNSKQSIMVISKAFKIPVSSFPKPEEAAFTEFRDELFSLKTSNATARFEMLAFIAALMVYRKYSDYTLEQVLSCFAYCLACQRFILDDIQGTLDEYIEASMSIRTYGNYSYTLYKEITTFEKLNIIMHRSDGTSTNDLPIALLKHISAFGTIEEMIAEVCRLQKLSPAFILSEDPKKALINAWDVTQKGDS